MPKEEQTKYIDRIKEELTIIETLGFIDYILMVWDVCDFCDQNSIPRGPGRGSVSSSIVCYLAGKGITKLDSIKYGTFFARFLSAARAKVKIVDGIKYIDGSVAPDIDLDICYYRRQEVLDYTAAKYPNRTASTLTVGQLKPRLALKDVLKCYAEMSPGQAQGISDLLEDEQGQTEDFDAALSDNKEIGNKLFKEWYETAPKAKEYVSLAKQLVYLKNTEGKHASSFLVSHDPIGDLIPMQMSKDNDCVISGFDMHGVQNIMLKFDFLGLKNISVIHDVCRRLKIDPDDIDIHDQCIYDFLANPKHLYGIFQFESFAQGEMAKKIKPKNFQQIAESLSISRPGASANLSQYLDYVHRGIYKEIHPLLDPTLKETGGVCLMQEQYLRMLVSIGLTPDEAEIARKVLGKKLKEKIPEILKKIEEVCIRNGHPPEISKLLLKIAEDSGGYQFSSAHALAYGIISAQTVYLKVKYPMEFMLACLKMAVHDQPEKRKEAIQRIMEEARDIGIKILPPDVCKSANDYSIRDGCILTGLSAIKGLAGKGIEKLEKYIRENSNRFQIFEHFEQAGLPINVVTPLVLCGAVNTGGDGRTKLLMQYELYKVLTQKEKLLVHNLGDKYNYDLIKLVNAMNAEIKDEKGKQLIKDSRKATIKKAFTPFWEKYKRNTQFEDLSNFIYENEYLGQSFTQSLKSIYSNTISNLKDTKELSLLKENSKCVMVGIIAELEKRVSKKGSPYIKVGLSDNIGNISCLIFMSDRIAAMDSQNGGPLKENDIVVAHMVKKEGGSYFCDNFVRQTCPVVLKKSTIEKEIAAKENKEG